jgi:hypothetical protein
MRFKKADESGVTYTAQADPKIIRYWIIFDIHVFGYWGEISQQLFSYLLLQEFP